MTIELILPTYAVRHIWGSVKRIIMSIPGLTGKNTGCQENTCQLHMWSECRPLLAAFGSPEMNLSTFLRGGDNSIDSLSAVGSVDKTVAIRMAETRFREKIKLTLHESTSLSEMSPLEALENCPTTAFITCREIAKKIRQSIF